MNTMLDDQISRLNKETICLFHELLENLSIYLSIYLSISLCLSVSLSLYI